MRKTCLAAIALTLAATAAHAQSSRRDDRDDGWRSDRREWRDDRGGDRNDDRRGPSSMMGNQGGRGARFMVRNGDTRIGVACDPGETMRNCVDAALLLFDRVRQAGPSASSGSSSSSAPTTTAPTPSPSR
jgi:hypothetical protein